jgi:hypothetical protein
MHGGSDFTRVPLKACGEAAEPNVSHVTADSVDVDRRTDRYRGAMTKRTWTLLTWSGVAIAVGGVIAAVVGFSMDETYPEEAPAWAFPLIWVGALVAVGAVVGKVVAKS